MTTHSSSRPLAHGARPGNGPVAAFVQLVATWQSRRKARRALARLDANLLRDIGLDPLTASYEYDLPFWKE